MADPPNSAGFEVQPSPVFGLQQPLSRQTSPRDLHQGIQEVQGEINHGLSSGTLGRSGVTTTQGLTNQIVSEMEEMKERHLANMTKLLYRTAESSAFEFAMGLVIVTNSIMIGVDAEFRWENDGAAGERFILITQWCFSACYIIEVAIKLAGYGCKVYFLGQDRWSNYMDFSLTVIGLVEALLLLAAEAGSMKNMLVLRGFRIVRFLRLVRMIKAFRQLQLFMAALFDAFKVVIWGIMLTMLVIYMCAIYVKALMEDYADDPEVNAAWGSLAKSMYSFFRITTLDDWASLSDMVIVHYKHMIPFFICFICVTSFAFINVMTAVVVENVLSRALANNAEAEEKASHELKGAIRSIYEAFSSADLDHDQMLSREEFHEGLSNHNIQRALLKADISLEDVDELFDVLDHKGTGQLTLEEFMEGCLRGRGVAKGKDLLLVACDLRRYMTSVVSLLLQLTDPSCTNANGSHLEIQDEEFKRLVSLRSRSKLLVSEHLDACSEGSCPLFEDLHLHNGECHAPGQLSRSQSRNLPSESGFSLSNSPLSPRSAARANNNGRDPGALPEVQVPAPLPYPNIAGSSTDAGTDLWHIASDPLNPQECFHAAQTSPFGSPVAREPNSAPLTCPRCAQAQARAEKAEAEVRELKAKMRSLLQPMQELARDNLFESL